MLKMHIGNTLRGHQGMLRAPDMMLEDTSSAKKYVGDVGGVMVKNIL
jgi:hypothetical protein